MKEGYQNEYSIISLWLELVMSLSHNINNANDTNGNNNNNNNGDNKHDINNNNNNIR